jgi:tetratricopeptide (TPR) repeat protein
LFRKAYTLLVVLLIPLLIHAQGPRERSAAKNITKQRWNKAFSDLQKSLSKDKQNLPAYYLLSTYYFSERNPRFQLDSAYQNVQKAIKLWNFADAKTRNKWSRFPVDSISLIDLRDRIDSASFIKAREINTLAEYSRFIDQHPQAKQKQTAINLRYEVAFAQAQEENTFQSFQSFIQTYPEAPQLADAKKKYEELLFVYSTKDHRLESFESFLKDNPQSPYRAVAEKNIFDILTAPGKPENFLKFLRDYPQSNFRKQGTDILYHLLREQNESLPPDCLTDSLSELISLEKEYLVPIYVKDKFGLINSFGKQVLAPMFEEIDEAYICGDITEEVIVLPGKMINRKGEALLNGNIKEIEDVGFGFLKIKVDDKSILFHKSGYPIGDFSVEDVKILNGRVLAIKNSSHWGIHTLTGRRIIPFEYDAIENIGELLVFSKDNQYTFSSIDTIASSVHGIEPVFLGPFDEIKKMGENIWVRKGQMQGTFNQKLKEGIPMGANQINPTFFGAVVESPEGTITYNQYGEPSEYFQKVNIVEPWIAAKTSDGWVLYNAEQRIYKSVPYDTLSLFGPFAVGKTKAGLELNLLKKPEKLLTIRDVDHLEFLPGKDSVSYLMTTSGSKKTIYDPQGQLFTVTYDRIETAGSGYFIVHKKEKKGLINSSGKVILPISYDAIGTAVNGMISLLKGMKFGAYDLHQKKLIPPIYDKNIIHFDNNTLVAYKGTAYGFVNKQNKPLSEFVFSEIQPWSDSIALVKKNGLFQLYNFYKKTADVTSISAIKTIKDTPEEKLIIISNEGNYGVVSNKKGIVIPIKFSDIVNVGSRDKPMYFTEKHVQEASIFVVIYYDSTGKMLRKEVYEQDDYERIYCDKK